MKFLSIGKGAGKYLTGSAHARMFVDEDRAHLDVTLTLELKLFRGGKALLPCSENREAGGKYFTDSIHI